MMPYRALSVLTLLLGLASSTAGYAQAPPAVPALPDTERRTSYTISGTTCACSVGFAIYGDNTDVDEWIQVWIAGVRYLSTDPTFGWALSSATGPLATIPRPITDAVLTFNSAQTGTVQIVGARRPRRLTQFTENRGVSARDLNQALTDIVAENRENWDAVRPLFGGFGWPPAVSGNQNVFATVSGPKTSGACLDFDGNGNIVAGSGACVSSGSGVTSGTANELAYYATTGSVVSGLASGANCVYSTNGSSVPSCVTSLPSGLAIPLQQGRVTMTRASQSGTWQVRDANNSIVNISSSTTGGLQEAITTAANEGVCLNVEGGGQTSPSNVQTDWGSITATTTITFPASTKSCWRINGVSLKLNTGSSDGVVFDSWDMGHFFFSGQMIYSGTGSIMRMKPTNANQEGFTQGTSGYFEIGTLVCVISSSNGTPDGSKGIGIRFSESAGPISGNKFNFTEINGCQVGLQVDLPAATPSDNFTLNIVDAADIHSQNGSALTIGTGSTNASGISANVFRGNLNPNGASAHAIDTWATQNLYEVSIGSALIGINLQSSSTVETFVVGGNGGTTKFNDASSAHTSRVIGALAQIVTINASVFSALGTCGAGGYPAGSLAQVTDSTTTTWGATITGGSVNNVLAYCDGVNWTVAAK